MPGANQGDISDYAKFRLTLNKQNNSICLFTATINTHPRKSRVLLNKMALQVFSLVIAVSIFAFVKCQNEGTSVSDDVDAEKKVGIVYFVSFYQTVPEEKNEKEENLNEIDTVERKILPLPRFLLILDPARRGEVIDNETVAPEAEITANRREEVAPKERSKRSPGGYGGGCNTCGSNYGNGGGGRGSGGGGNGSWSTSSSSASSGSWGGGGGGQGGKFGHGRK